MFKINTEQVEVENTQKNLPFERDLWTKKLKQATEDSSVFPKNVSVS